MHVTTATIYDQPYQFCCHLGIQSLSFPRTANVITAMPIKNADVSVTNEVISMKRDETLPRFFEIASMNVSIKASSMESIDRVEKAWTTLNQGVDIQEKSILVSGENIHQQPV